MKSSLKTVSRLIMSGLILSMITGIAGCKSTADDENGTAISLLKDGTIETSIEESFEQSYYDKDELEQSILELTASYNANAAGGGITLENVEVKNSMALVQMKYAMAKDYAAFNKAVFFVGTAQDAVDEGYDLNVVLSSVKDPADTVGKADILAQEDGKILITDVNEVIELNGRALYVSDNVTAASNGKTIRRTDDGDKLAYIVYK